MEPTQFELISFLAILAGFTLLTGYFWKAEK